MPLLHLPVLQNWDCHTCGSCCRQYEVTITDEERRRIKAQGWEQDAHLAGLPPVVRVGWRGSRYRLNQRATGECVFLSADNRCRIHERFGAEAKPLACRLYPFVLIPAGDHWRVGVRFACPSATANRGRAVTEHSPELNQYTYLLERQAGREVHTQPAPPLQGRQAVDWPDVGRFVQTLLSLLKQRGDRLERRVRKCLALAALCRQARFEKLSGGRLTEFLDVVAAGLDGEVPADPSEVPLPSWIGRLLFRQLAAVFARKDRGELRGPVTRSRLALFWAACRFALARGTVPLVNGRMAPTTFAQMEAPAGALPAEAEALLERYYLVKVESLQFCGPANFDLPFWDGLESLALTLPAILWLARSFRTASRTEAIRDAVGIVDDHFGYNRVLKLDYHRFAMRTLAQRGELARLIAWYSR